MNLLDNNYQKERNESNIYMRNGDLCMKRIIKVLLVLMMIVGLSACGKEEEKNEPTIVGTWKLTGAITNGVEYSIEEFQTTYSTDVANIKLYFNEDNRAFLHDGTNAVEFDWAFNEGDNEKFMLGSMFEGAYDGRYVKIDNGDGYLLKFEKESKDQYPTD